MCWRCVLGLLVFRSDLFKSSTKFFNKGVHILFYHCCIIGFCPFWSVDHVQELSRHRHPGPALKLSQGVAHPICFCLHIASFCLLSLCVPLVKRICFSFLFSFLVLKKKKFFLSCCSCFLRLFGIYSIITFFLFHQLCKWKVARVYFVWRVSGIVFMGEIHTV